MMRYGFPVAITTLCHPLEPPLDKRALHSTVTTTLRIKKGQICLSSVAVVHVVPNKQNEINL